MTAGSGIERSELVSLVGPSGLVEAMDEMGRDAEAESGDDADLRTGGATIAKESLDGLRTLGIVQFVGDRVSLAATQTHWRRPADVTACDFARVALERIVAVAKPDAEFGDKTGVTDLVHSLVVLHTAVEPLRPFTAFESTTKDTTRDFMNELRDRFGDVRSNWPFPNREQWQSLRRWGPYLGLASTVGDSGLVADASAALLRHLSLAPGEYEVAQFVSACASAVPILDGGSLHFGHDSQRSGSHAVLSPGMSVSLMQLEARGTLTFASRSDISARTIRTTADVSGDRTISHVVWSGGIDRGKVKR
jgi:hypothetical protein